VWSGSNKQLFDLAPPTAPRISGYEVGHQLSVGDDVALSCTAGVPAPALGWYHGDASVDQRPLSSSCDTTQTSGADVTTTCRSLNY